MNNIREKRQEEGVNSFLNTKDYRGILLMAPRVGKVRTTFKIINELQPKSILLAYPRNDIQKSWIDEAKLLNIDISNFEYTTFVSLKKITKKYDLVIIDEIHECSSKQKEELKIICNRTSTLGLTGTLTRKTADSLYKILNLSVCYSYSINKAVEENVLSPYQIYVHKVNLDDNIKYIKPYKYYSTVYTEKVYFDKLHFRSEYIKKELEKFTKGEIRLESKDVIAYNNESFFINLKQINIIQNSIAKLNKTIDLLKQFGEQRVLIFCGTTNTTDSIGIPVYHSKAKEKKVFEDFAEGKGNPHLATIKMLTAGVTIRPIDKGIISYTSGSPETCAQTVCRFLGTEINYPSKEAEIHIISINHPFEILRMQTALNFFDNNRIHGLEEENKQIELL